MDKTFTIDFSGFFPSDKRPKLTIDVPESFHEKAFSSPLPTEGCFDCTFEEEKPSVGAIRDIFSKWAELMYDQPIYKDPLAEFRPRALKAVNEIQQHNFEVNKVFTCEITELEHWSYGIPDSKFLREYESGTIVVYIPVVKAQKFEIIHCIDKQLSARLSFLAGKKVKARYCYAITEKFEKNGLAYTKPDLIDNFVLLHTLKFGNVKSIYHGSTELQLTDGTIGNSSLIATAVLDYVNPYDIDPTEQKPMNKVSVEINTETNGEI
jgi:hypothetical protein